MNNKIVLEMKPYEKEMPERCVELMNMALEVLEYEYPLHGFFEKGKTAHIYS